jgi:HAMP domain-containing protein
MEATLRGYLEVLAVTAALALGGVLVLASYAWVTQPL